MDKDKGEMSWAFPLFCACSDDDSTERSVGSLLLVLCLTSSIGLVELPSI